MRVKDAVGRYGEQVAVAHLESAGLEVLERNWRCREGELDAIARDGTTIVFVEVKTRSSTLYGTPAEAVTRAKLARLRRLSMLWLAAHPEAHGASAVRFDVVSVLRRRDTLPLVEHLRGVS
jgi:putative endonuclease